MASSDSSLRFRYREVSRVPLLNFPNTRSSYAPPRFHRPSRFDGILSASQRLNCWPRGTLVTRLYERGSFALSLIRSSGETRAHRSPSARPAFLTVRRLLYSNDSFHSFSSAEFCSAYQTPTPPPLNLPYGTYITLYIPLREENLLHAGRRKQRSNHPPRRQEYF